MLNEAWSCKYSYWWYSDSLLVEKDCNNSVADFRMEFASQEKLLSSAGCRLHVDDFRHDVILMPLWYYQWPKSRQSSARAKPKPRLLFVVSTTRKQLLDLDHFNFISSIWVQYEWFYNVIIIKVMSGWLWTCHILLWHIHSLAKSSAKIE